MLIICFSVAKIIIIPNFTDIVLTVRFMCRRILILSLAVLCSTTAFSLPCDSLKKLVMFWNVENFYDPFDDSLTRDEDFTPDGFKNWTWSRFTFKRNSIAKTILSVKDAYGTFPSIVGFAEVENYLVLKQLTAETILSRLDYGIVHRDSPDIRGIDVAIIYRRGDFTPLRVQAFPVFTGSGRPTRDILYVKGVLQDNDTLELFVVHFPSKFGGAAVTGPLREAAARRLLEIIDSTGGAISASEDLLQRNIIVMGDFNDTPESSSIGMLIDEGLMCAGEQSLNRKSIGSKTLNDIGTIKFNGRWEQIDHFLVSPSLEDCPMSVYAPQMLLESDEKYLGTKPFRSFYGPRWNTGPSDHLPILLEL